jgi:replicative DNA helicase
VSFPTEAPIVNLEAEESVLGAVMVTDIISAVLNDAKLTPEHFYAESHRVIFRACVTLYERGERIDALTVHGELQRQAETRDIDRSRISQLASTVPVAGNAIHYARLVQESAKWRHYEAASRRLYKAARDYDEEGVAEAEAMIGSDVVRKGELLTPELLAVKLHEHLTAAETDVFNQRTGGMFRGQLSLWSGWTSHGKSVLVDQMLETVLKRPYRGCLYINEMAELERVARIIARYTAIPYTKIMAANLNEGELADVLAEVGYNGSHKRLPFPIVNCTGWSADEIAHDIRRWRWDFAVVDILHEIPHEDEKDLRQIGSALNRAAKQANCHVVATAHLNEHRAHKSTPPLPVLSDIRGSGMLKNQADFVGFVYLDQPNDSPLEPDNTGHIYLAKGRSTGRCSMAAKLHPSRFRWEPDASPRSRGPEVAPPPPLPPAQGELAAI